MISPATARPAESMIRWETLRDRILTAITDDSIFGARFRCLGVVKQRDRFGPIG
jgi:hypothetical protein